MRRWVEHTGEVELEVEARSEAQERDAVVPERVEALVLDAGGLRAEVVARRTPPRPLVKAVTWHRLRFEPLGEGFRARVVLDV